MKHRVPPFPHFPAACARDYCTQAGAAELGRMVQEAWAKLGHTVPFTVERVGHKDARDPVYTLRFPTLINGLPT
jgi:hypothetical protein